MSKVVVINVLAKQFYDDCHITGSINVPFQDIEHFAKTASKENPVVVYCARYECHASEQAYRDLMRLGFHDVYEYAGGTAEWFQKGYPVTGPAEEKYLHTPTVAHKAPEDVRVISAENLKKMMQK